MRKRLYILMALLLLTCPALASDEGTRHITGSGMDVYFMNDKVFGTTGRLEETENDRTSLRKGGNGHPLWAIYNCGSDINGEIDINGTYHYFAFKYHCQADRIITGKFGPLKMSLGKIEKANAGFTYHVFVDEKECLFSIRYEKVEDDHLVNSIIEGKLQNEKEIRLTVDGPLCPFATTGIIMIASGAYALDSDRRCPKRAGSQGVRTDF
jgi:hypothetical protein